MESRYLPPNYLLFHDDCHLALDYLQGVEARLVLTDPPYGKVLKDDWDQSGHVTDQWCEQIKGACTPDASIYVWCGIGEKSRSLIEFMQVLDRHFTFKDLITWQKRRGIGMRRGWLYTREELLWYVVNPKDFVWNKDAQYSDEPNAFKKGMSGTQVNEKKRITNVWTDIPEQLKKPLGTHPADKPMQALKRVIAAHTDPKDRVLDP
ncbi:MAG: site-specific DNA-methyltransferase, partial [Candidatus Omnitrophota bacterium]